MTTDYHSALDLTVLRALNVDGGRFLDLAFLSLSAKWFGLLAGAGVVLLVLLRGGRRRPALLFGLALAIVFSDFLGAQVLRPLLGRMRPCYALPEVVRRLGASADVGSLPSLHAANFFALAGIAWTVSRRAGAVALAVAALVALSRVYLGVHWPTDVLAGAAWGLCCAWAAVAAARALLDAIQRRRPRPARST